jgi:hypothetical protein
LLAALLVRILWVAIVPVVPLYDSQMYDTYARILAAGKGYSWPDGKPAVLWPVGPPFLFSLCYRAFGSGYTSIIAVNLVLGIASVAMTMVLARRYFGSPADLLTGLLLAFWPNQVEFTTVLSSETPFIALMLAAWLIFEDNRVPSVVRAILFAVLITAAAFMRPIALLLPPVFALGRLAAGQRLRESVVELIIVAIVMAACIAPWAARNYRLFGDVVLISANGGVNTWMGNNPATTGFFHSPPATHPGMNEVERDRAVGAAARAYIMRYPARFVGRSLVKFVRLHERECVGWNDGGLTQRFPAWAIRAFKITSHLYWWAALAFAITGIVTLARVHGLRSALLHPAVLIWGYFSIVYAVTVIDPRYHVPSIPCMAILGGFYLSHRLQTKVGAPRQDQDMDRRRPDAMSA